MTKTSVTSDDLQTLQESLDEEDRRERTRDAKYWQSLKADLEQMREGHRHNRIQRG